MKRYLGLIAGLFLLVYSAQAQGPCGGGPCEVCGVSATIISINGGTINNGNSSVPGQVQAGQTGMGTTPLEVTANTCGEIELYVELNFDWDHGQNNNWLHGISFINSAGWSAATGVLPGPGWLFFPTITGVCSGNTYGAGYYYDPPGTGGDSGNNSSYDGTNCGGGFSEGADPWLIDGDPSDNFGDDCQGNCPAFGFNLTYCPINGGTATENISFILTEDGETGGWVNSDQCVFSLSFDININSAGVQIPETVTICEGECTTLDAGTGCDSYLWSTNETTPSITVCPTATTIYSVTVTGSTGCLIEGDTEVFVEVCCDADAGMLTATPPTACPGEIINFSVSGHNTDPTLTQMLLVADASGNIVQVINGTSGTLTSLICEGYTIYSYNYLTSGASVVPVVGDNISIIDCTIECCDLMSIPVSFEDNENPVFPNPPADENLVCYDQVPILTDLNWTDNCDGTGMVAGVESGSIDMCAGGTITRTWDYTDACGNTVSYSQNITAAPIDAPTFQNVPASMTVACDAIPTSFPDLTYTNGGVGACLIEGTVSPTVVGAPNSCGGTLIANWDFTDACGNNITANQTITVDPAPIPTFINPPADITVDCDAIPTSAPDLSYSNNETGVCLLDGMASPVQSGSADLCGGTITFTWDATDFCGNPITHSQNVTVNPAPLATYVNPPADITVSCDAIPTSAPDLTYTNNQTGACEISGTTSAVQNGSANSCGGSFTFTWMDTDQCGNPISYTQNITVTPAPPTAFLNPPTNISVPCNAAPTSAGPLNYSNGALGSCLFEGSVSPTMSGSFDECGGAITFTWEVTDPCGTPVSHVQTVTVDPAPAPQFTSPLPTNFNIDCGNFMNNPPTLDYSNNETGSCLISGSILPVESGSYNACGGTIMYNWDFTDDCGNTLSHAQTITIDPAPPAVFTSQLPQNFTIDCASFSNNPPALNYSNSESGLCLIEGSIAAQQQGSYTECGGSISNLWMFTDDCGRSISHTQVITIDPAPVATFDALPGPISLACDAVPATPPALTYNNNESGVCNISGSVTAIQSGSYNSCGGTIFYTWTFTDNCNRTITHTQDVTITPASEPTWINPPSNVTINCGQNLPPPDPLNYSNGETGFCEISGAVPPTVSVNGLQTTYFWSFTNPCSGATITHTQIITQTPEPIILINPAMTNICAGESFDLSAISVIDQNGSPLTISYHSGTPAGPGNQIGSPFVSPTTTTTYYILGTNQFGCTDEGPFTINVETPPNAGTGLVGNICFNASFNVNLFDFLQGPYDSNGTWDDFNGYGVNLNDPQNVNLFAFAPGSVSFNYLVPGIQFCPPDIATITINILDEIVIDISSIECTGTDFYTIVINNPANYVIVGSAGITDNSTPGIVTITDIPISENIILTALDPNNLDCFVTQSVNAPDCDCPSIDPPINDGNMAICEGDTIPTLSVTVPAGQTANWYDVPTGGIALVTGSLTYIPITSGPGVYQYFVEAEEISSGCVSLTRTPIQLEINELPMAMNATLSACDDNDDGFTAFVLSDAEGDLSSTSGVGFTYYPTILDAENETNPLTLPYTNISNPQTIYVVVENGDGCSVIVNLLLEVLPLPLISISTENETCFEAADGTVEFLNLVPGDSVSLDGSTWQTNNTFSGLAAGNYTAYIQNSNGCISNQPFTIDPGLILTIDQFNQECQDNGTPSDATDDFFIITINVGNNLGSTGNYEVYNGTALLNTFAYGTSNTLQFPADGSTITLSIIDVANSCSIEQLVGPLISCSTDCTISMDQLDIVCNDNGTDLDPTDDFYTVTINASAINGATNNTYNLLINNAVSYNFPYNTISNFTIPADGASPLITIVDNEDQQCSTSSTIGPLTHCSNGCSIAISNIELNCNDNGTITDPNDDFYIININTTVSNPGISGQFEVLVDLVSLGTFSYGSTATINLPADGSSPVIQVQDVDDSDCFAVQTLNPLTDCAGTCILNASFENIECDDSQTGNDPSDDTFTFEVTVSGTNTGSNWTANSGESGAYNTPTILGPFLITDGVAQITITDDVTGTCSTTFSVNPPTECSDPCDISISSTMLSCDDNGTLTDPSDDFYNLTVITNVINPGSSGQYEVFINAVSVGIFNHGENAVTTWPADGTSPIVSVQDIDFPDCNNNLQIGPLTDCADACIINAVASNIQCDDNGTGNDPSDDTFTFDMTVSGNAAGSTWTATGGFGGLYDTPVTIGPFLITDGIQSFNINDDTDGSCVTTLTVNPPVSCSDPCALSIVNIEINCDDNGTVTNPSDDFYIVNITSSVTSPGSSNQYEVLVDATSYGIFNHGDIAMITLPADGTSPNITVQDIDFNGCSDNQQIGPLTDCAAACIINASFDNIQCDDNGTANDPTDDTFTFEVIATGSNVGSSWNTNGGPSGAYNTPVIFGPFLITDGIQNITLADDVTAGCTTSFSVTPPTACSDPCSIQIDNIDLDCNDNGTLTNPADDFYTATISSSVTNPGSSDQFEVFVDAISAGIFNHGDLATITIPADGNSPIISIQDLDFNGCSDNQQIGPLDDCAAACIINASFDNIQCNDNGTGNDPTDDTFTFEVTATGSNIGSTWNSNGGPTGAYNTSVIFGPFLISDGIQNVTLTDDVTSGCTTNFSVTPPTPCSDPCDIQIVNIELNCNDNGTATDPADDSYLVDVTTAVTNPGNSGQFEILVNNISVGVYSYGTIGSITIPANGTSPVISVNDVDFPGCSSDQTIGPLDNCAVACTINASFSNVVCDDNGTGNDPFDDTFTFEVELTGTNNATTWTATGGTIGNYNTPISFGPFLITDGLQTLSFEDNVTSSCMTQLLVNPPASCSNCVQTVEAGVGGEITCTDTTVTLVASSSEPGIYQWNGPANFTLQNSLTAEVSQPGFYYFEATYSDGCSAIDSVEVTIDNMLPVANGGPDDSLTCVVLDLILVGQLNNGQSGQWFNSSNQLISATNILFVDNPGTYYYQVTDDINGCTSPLDEVVITDAANFPDAIIFALPTDILNCLIVNIDLVSPPQDHVVYSWDVMGQTIVAPQVSINQANTYGLLAIDTLSGCISTDDIVITDLEEYPLINIDPADEITCYDPQIVLDASDSQSGPSIIYTWLDGTGTPIPGANGNTLTVDIGGTYFLELVDTLNGCENIDTVVVETLLNTPLADTGDNIDLPCDETSTSLNLNIQGGATSTNVSWSTDDGTILSGANSLTPSVNGVGYYFVNIQDIESGCSIIDSVLVSNNPDVPEIALLDVGNESCINFQNGSLNIGEIFGGEPPYSYTLNGQSTSTSSDFYDLSPGFYSLNIFDANGCEMDTSFTVEPGIDLELNLPAVIELMQNEPGFIEGITNVDVNELSVIQWTPSDLVSCDSCISTQVFGEDGQNYTLTIVHENGCFAIANLRIVVRPDIEIYIPNAFSPNSDGNNDGFTLFANEEVEEILEMIIADRWGEIVYRNENFDPNDLSLGWNGTFKGENMNPAVFVYYFRVKLLNGTTRDFSGDVTLMR